MLLFRSSLEEWGFLWMRSPNMIFYLKDSWNLFVKPDLIFEAELILISKTFQWLCLTFVFMIKLVEKIVKEFKNQIIIRFSKHIDSLWSSYIFLTILIKTKYVELLLCPFHEIPVPLSIIRILNLLTSNTCSGKGIRIHFK